MSGARAIPRRVALRIIAASLLVTSLGACGSTVRAGSVAAGSAASGTDLGLAIVPGAPAGPAGSEAPGPATTSADQGSTPSSAVRNVTTAPTASPVPGSATFADRRPLSLGLLYANNDAASGAGVNNGNTFTLGNVFDALVKVWNARGGLDGRKIVPVKAEVRSSSTSYTGDLQAACAKFTQDAHVAAVLSVTGIYFESFQQCLTKTHTPMVSGDYSLGDEEALRAAPGFIAATSVTVDARFRGALTQLAAAGRLTKSDKLGIVVEGCPYNDRAYDRSVVPTAKRLGIAIAERFEARCFQNLADLGGIASEMQTAVLQFKARGVTQVAFISGGVEGNFVLLFLTAAQSQGFQPGYALTSAAAAVVQEANTPKTQLAHAVGYGWLPTLDTSRATFTRAAQVACLADLRKGGLQPASSTDRDFAFSACDAFGLYNAALSAAHGSTEQGALIAGVHSLGTSFAAAEALAGTTDFSGDRRTGPARGRLFAWSQSCGCFDYTGDAFALTR